MKILDTLLKTLVSKFVDFIANILDPDGIDIHGVDESLEEGEYI